MKYNKIERTIYSLCEEIDHLEEEVDYWKKKYENEVKERNNEWKERLEESQKGIAMALSFALNAKEDEQGNLIIDKEGRQEIAAKI